MNTQVLELNDQDLQTINGGGMLGAAVNFGVGLIPGVGLLNNVVNLTTDHSAGRFVEKIFS